MQHRKIPKYKNPNPRLPWTTLLRPTALWALEACALDDGAWGIPALRREGGEHHSLRYHSYCY